MKRGSLTLLAAAIITSVAVPVFARGAAEAPRFSSASIAGAWAWSYSGQLVRYPFASIGIATFDGRGNCSIALKENSGVNRAYDHTSDSCSYEVTRDGMGTAEFSLDGEEGSIEFSVAGDEIRFMSPDAGVVAAGVMQRNAQVTKKEPRGEWGFLLDGTIFGENATGSGVMRFAPGGKCAQSLVYNYGTGRQSVKTETCNYEIDDKGFGSLDISYDNGTGGDAFFVMAERGRRIFFLTTARGEILLGDARRR